MGKKTKFYKSNQDYIRKIKKTDNYKQKIKNESQRFNEKILNNKSKLIKGEDKKDNFKSKNHKKRLRNNFLKDEKIKNDNQNFKDNLLSSDTDKDTNNKEIKSLRKNKNKKQVFNYLKEEKKNKEIGREYNENKIYDPLSKDLDNDGIVDRYDNDFKNSDYFESTYDVDKIKNNQKTIYKKGNKRKNYKNFYTRNDKKDILKKSCTKDLKEEKILNSLDKTTLKKLSKKEKKFLQKKELKKNNYNTISNSSYIVRDYLSEGSDDNKGVESGEKIADVAYKLSNKLKNKASDKRFNKKSYLNKLENKANVKKSKLEFKKSVKNLKKDKDYKKLSKYKKFKKRKQMKNAIYKNSKTRIRDRVKKSVLEILQSSVKLIKTKSKGFLIFVVCLLFLIMTTFNLVGTTLIGTMNNSASVLATNYLSSEKVLKGIENEFFNREENLRNEIDSVEQNFPGYDEYIVQKDESVGHNVHELLSYITSRYGEVKNVFEVSNALDELFDEMYEIKYTEEIEIRHRNVAKTFINDEGNVTTDIYKEPYEYKKLRVSLNKREMGDVIKDVFKDYPDNMLHYKVLFANKGNMKELFGNKELIVSNGGIGGGAEYKASKEVQKRIVDAAYITPSPGAGWCAMWVSQVYQNAGLEYIGGNANDMYRNFTYTSDRSKLKVGMLVAVESSSSGSEAGRIYGHVGIYIGDGKVMDNIGIIRVTTLDDWISSFCQDHPVGFGFPPSVNK